LQRMEELQEKLKKSEEENTFLKNQYETILDEYESRYKKMEDEKKSLYKEHIVNLQTLVKEMTYIEDLNSQLTFQASQLKEELQKLNQELQSELQKNKQLPTED